MRMEEVPGGPLTIEAFGNGGFRIGGGRHEGAVLLGPDGVRPWDLSPDFDLCLRALADAFDDIEVLLIGGGQTLPQVAPETRAMLESTGLGIEAMGTAAACRTFNLLSVEGRRVAAALMPV